MAGKVQHIPPREPSMPANVDGDGIGPHDDPVLHDDGGSRLSNNDHPRRSRAGARLPGTLTEQGDGQDESTEQ